jgi:chaperonin GroES
VIPLKPLGERVLVRPLQPETVTASGIVLVEDRVPETMGTIVAIGEVIPPLPPDSVQVGDVVVFSWQAGQEVLMDGERLIMLYQDDLLATVEETHV